MNSLAINFHRALFRVLRCSNLSKDWTYPVLDGPIKGYKFSFAVGNPYMFGQYEKEGVDLVSSLVKPSDCIYDIGANAGYMTMIFAKLAKQVYAFEPMPKNLKRLNHHLQINSVNNVKVFPFAMCDKRQQLMFSMDDNPVTNTYISDSPTFSSSADKFAVEGISIDAFVDEQLGLPPDFLKIDVEGAELDVLHGAKHTLSQYRPKILLATHEHHLPGAKEKCIGFLKEQNYTCTQTGEEKINSNYADFICVPNAAN